MKWNPLKWPILCNGGILVIVLYCFFRFTSWALYPAPYSPVTHWLSDLGNWARTPIGAFFYNAGCVLTGLALFPFFIGLYKWYTEEKWRKTLLILTQVVGLCSALALIMIGVFSEDYRVPHMLSSAVFFTLNFIVLIIANIALVTHPRFAKPIAFYGFTIDILSLILDLTIGGPIIEWFTVFASLGYVGLLVVNTFKLAYPS